MFRFQGPDVVPSERHIVNTSEPWVNRNSLALLVVVSAFRRLPGPAEAEHYVAADFGVRLKPDTTFNQ